jgi:sugar (pentulose or hexulose) kinase
VPPGADGVAFAPHLGGRVTPNDPHQRGLWHGFGWSHGRGHLYRALLEGVALEYGLYLRGIRRLHPGLGPLVVHAVGGGARSALWGGIKADVLAASYRPLRARRAAPSAARCWRARPSACSTRPPRPSAWGELDAGPDPDPGRSAVYADLSPATPRCSTPPGPRAGAGPAPRVGGRGGHRRGGRRRRHERP